MRINLMVLLLISLMVLGGCSRISVYVLDQAELIKVKSGETITVKYDGWLLSNRAVDRVMNAKVKAVNLQ